MHHKSGLFLALALVFLIARVTALYIMDDRNSTIAYSPLGKAIATNGNMSYYNTITQMGAGSGQDQRCHTQDTCRISFPFTGSGVTLYADISWALSFNVSIDGIPASSAHFDGVYGCCNDTFPQVHNRSIYNIQSLPLGPHYLVLQMLDTSGSIAVAADNGSEIYFDYAVVNETAPAPQHPRKRLAPIIGGALGGTAAVVALGVFFIRRSRQGGTGAPVSDKQEREEPVFAAGLRHHFAPGAYPLHAGGEFPPTTTPNISPTFYPPPRHETPTPTTPTSRGEEESQLLARMYTLGLPASEIARTVEAMRGQSQTAQRPGSGAFVGGVSDPQLPRYGF